jgi:DNA-binding HxlR family transcriptional regulator
MKNRNEYTCPLELAHDITKGKWKPIILWLLGYEKQSLSMLKSGIKGISQKILIEQLKELIDNGLVGKITFDGYPLKVEYFLTKRGEKMLDAIRIMQGIGIEMMIEDGRSDFLKEKGLL